VLLFIDRLPLYSWVSPWALSGLRLLSVSFPLIVTDPGSGPRPRARPQRWALDTRFTGEAYAWRHHLVEAGLNPEVLRNGSTYLTPLGSAPQEFPLRGADLWLVSNIPALRSTPHRIELDDGVAFRDVQSLPNPESNCPLLGIRALEGAGLKVLVDFARRTVSVWVPGPWYRRLWLFLQRVPTGFSTTPAPWGK
jgi:hypothetical protein